MPSTDRFSRVVLATLLCTTVPAAAQFTQQGPKLVGSGGAGSVIRQGCAVALSADGNTAVVGGEDDNSLLGATWIYTRTAGVWAQQGPKLVGSGNVGGGFQGGSVAVSADGNTVIAGGPFDNGMLGAAWVFTRSGGIWNQQGPKLVGTGSMFGSEQGGAVGLSADGNTAIVGGPGDNGNAGAVWVFTRSAGVWSQQGPKLVGSGVGGPAALQGVSVGLSADGNTAIVAGPADNGSIGAAWIFIRSAGVWSQQGSKLVGTGATPSASFAMSVAISGDGNTAILGNGSDGGSAGAAWVFTRTGGVWSQQGSKIVPTGAVGLPSAGASVSMSGDGNLAILGGEADTGFTGAAWVFARSGTVWSQLGSKLVGAGATAVPSFGSSVGLSADGTTAIVGGLTDNSAEGAAWIFVQPADLAIVKSNSAGLAALPNTNLTYTLNVTNNGPGVATGVTVTDALPAGVTFVSATPSAGSCSGTTTVICSNPTLANGSSEIITLAVTTGTSLGAISNTATVTAATTDPNSANDSSTSSLIIVAALPATTPAGLLLLALVLAIAGTLARRP